MDYGLVLLWVVNIAVLSKNVECRGNIRDSASFQLIDAANNALIDLSPAWKIVIEGVNGRNGVDGVLGTLLVV